LTDLLMRRTFVHVAMLAMVLIIAVVTILKARR
jgi:hypothetical protein